MAMMALAHRPGNEMQVLSIYRHTRIGDSSVSQALPFSTKAHSRLHLDPIEASEHI